MRSKKHGVGYCDHLPALLSAAAIGFGHLPTEMNSLLKIADRYERLSDTPAGLHYLTFVILMLKVARILA